MTNSRHLLALSLICLIGACTVEKADIRPDGTLDVLGPVPGFVKKDGLPGNWVLEGPARAWQENLKAVSHGSIPALKITPGDEQFVVALRTQALMLATPYLSWSWNMETDEGGMHPVRMVVGFEQGKNGSMRWQTRPQDWFQNTLPPHQRAITILWAESALERGSFHLPTGKKGDRTAPRYIARGGRENTYSWWLETVDLANLYARAWPDEDLSRVRITFIGLAVDKNPTRTALAPTPTAYVSGIRLSR